MTGGASKAQIISHLFVEREHDARVPFSANNPVDESEAFQKLCEACRRGDVKTVQYLIQFENVNLNAVDKYDYPPLTLASLCGHYDVAQLLLESGALCERDTFQGERCLYSALNDNIRNLLLKYDFSKSIDEKQPFASHLSSLLSLYPLDTSDVTVSTTYLAEPLPNSTETRIFTKDFHLHRFLLCARSQYFRRKLQPTDETKKSPRHINLASSIDSKAFESTVKFLYCGEITELFSPEVTANIERISSHLDLPALWEFVLASHDPKQRRLKRMDEVDKAQEDLNSWFREFVIGKAARVEKEKAERFHMGQQNPTFADIILRADEEVEDRPLSAPLDWKPMAVFYPVHKAMLRSEFFTIMFTSSFKEGKKYTPDEPLQILSLEIAPIVLETVLDFLYSDKAEISLYLALDTLYAADQLFIERLKTKAAMVISTQGNAGLPGDQEVSKNGDSSGEGYNVYDVIRGGWATRVRRLEEFGAKYIAERLEDYIEEEAFADLVKESADRIKERQETDTIELIDDIRYYLDQRFRMRMDDLDAAIMYDELAPLGDTTPEAEAEKQGEDDGKTAHESPMANGDQKGVGKTEENGVFTAEKLHEPSKPDEWTKEELEADFMRAEAIKFDELLGRIDGLLERLNLDA